MNYQLSEAAEPIYEALERLVGRDESRRPFVVVDVVGRPEVFVQFATKDEVLYFDVPLLGIRLERTTSTLGSIRAVVVLGLELDVRPDERVAIHEEEGQPPPWRSDFWKKLFERLCGQTLDSEGHLVHFFGSTKG